MRGSVHKRCSHGTTGTPGKPACRKPHGSWYWRADAERDQTGRRTQPGQGGYRSREEAEEALAKHLAAVSTGTYAADQALTVKAWLTSWVDSLTLEPKTVTGYASHVEQVLIPHLGRRRLRDLRRQHIEDMIRELRDETPETRPAPPRNTKCGRPKDDGTPCRRWACKGDTACPDHGGTPRTDPGPGRGGRATGPRSAGTLDSYRRTLRTALSAAVRRGLITANPAQGRIDAMPKQTRRDSTWWEPEQVGRFLVAVQGDRLAALYELAAFAGLRRGELLGLRWEDVDLTDPTPGVSIRQTLSELSGPQDCAVCGDVHMSRRLKVDTRTGTGTKSAAGRRWVPLVGGTVREMIAHQASQSSERTTWASDYRDHGLVFADERGDPLSPTGTTKRFDEIASGLDLPRIRLHDMRHGAASLLLAAGVPIEMVAMILGHASPAVTRDVYAHLLKGPAAEGMRAAMALVRPDPES